MSTYDDDLRLALDALDTRQVPAALTGWEERALTALRTTAVRRPITRFRLLVAACIVLAALVFFVASGVAARMGVPNPIDFVLGHGHGPAPHRAVSPSPSPMPARQLVVAAVIGPAGNGVGVVDSKGDVRQLVAPRGGAIRALAWSPDGLHLAYLQVAATQGGGAGASAGGAGSVGAGGGGAEGTGGHTALWCYDVQRAVAIRIGLRRAASVEGFTWLGPHTLVVSATSATVGAHKANGTLRQYDLTSRTWRPLRDAAGHVLLGVSPSWSEHRKLLVYVSYGPTHLDATSRAKTDERLLAFHTESVKVSVLATGSSWYDGDAFDHPLVSPGGALVYSLQTGGDPSFVCAVRRTNGTKVLAMGDIVWPAPASWSSDGRLAFGGISASDWKHDTIQVWRPGKAAAAILAPTRRPIGSLAWSPKASQIAYSVTRASGDNGSLWVVDADGSNNHLLLAHGSWPAWAIAPVDLSRLPVISQGASPQPGRTGKAHPTHSSPKASPAAQAPSPLPSSWTGGGGGVPSGWKRQASGTTADLRGVQFDGANDGWAVGANGTIVATTDGGTSWQPRASGYGGWLDDVAFTGSGNGWAVSAQGAILATTDGGASWATQVAGGPGPLSAVAAVDATHAWAAGGTAVAQGRVLATTDGSTWHDQDVGDCERLLDIAFSDEDHGWAAGFAGTIIATTDGGATWRSQVPGDVSVDNATFTSVDFVDDSHGWIAGFYGGSSMRDVVLRTSDGGAHWTRCSLGQSGTQLQSVTFVDDEHGWATAQYRSQPVVLTTTDGGTTWRALARGRQRLVATCPGGGRVWAVGDGGMIVALAGS